jgi:hypothetical protein
MEFSQIIEKKKNLKKISIICENSINLKSEYCLRIWILLFVKNNKKILKIKYFNRKNEQEKIFYFSIFLRL